MNLSAVIEALIEERSLDRESVIATVRDGVCAGYSKKYPHITFDVKYNQRLGEIEVYAEKEIVAKAVEPDYEISLRRARSLDPDAEVGNLIFEPFHGEIGRVEMLITKQYIATHVRALEQKVVHDEFKEKEGTIVNGMVHKRERAGFSVKVGEAMAFLPNKNTVPGEILRAGYPVRALLSEVLEQSRGEHQLILDRASDQFVRCLLELEIPEVFEGLVAIKNIARSAGYKTKVVVSSESNDIDPVGTCVGVGGVRIKPILKELGREKIDLIEETEEIEDLIAAALKPAEIDKVVLNESEEIAVIWLAQDQRSFAIGKQGQNISLASQITGVHVQLQNDTSVSDNASALLAKHREEVEGEHGALSSNEESDENAASISGEE